MHQELIKKYSKRAQKLIALLKNKPEQYWIKRGEKKALEIFRTMAQRVPAYKKFLKKSNVNPYNIKTIEDFKKVPIINKQNYLLSYDISELCWDGVFEKGNWMIASTSGSTGEPFYFPRAFSQDEQFTLTAEICLIEYFQINKKSTLFIDCFALGVWIGGMFMYQAVRNIMNMGKYPLSIITPGGDKSEALKVIKSIGHHFDQIIIGGYGPLVKDLLDDGISKGINWRKYNIKYFFAAEGFTEGFRDYIAEIGGARNIYGDLINHYGTADLGTMSHETPASILIRRLALQDKVLFHKIFREANHLPTLTQSIPELFFFEEVDGRLLCSGLGGFPLVRYDLKDRGGVYTFGEIIQRFRSCGIDVKQEIRRHKLHKTLWNLPFVYLYERTDFVVGIYSVNIYPESIHKALENNELRHLLTGKFTMLTDFDENQNQFLEINIELKSGVKIKPTLKKLTLAAIISSLNKENSEWRDFYANPGIRDKITPYIKFWPYQHQKYFKPGGKQKWVKKRN